MSESLIVNALAVFVAPYAWGVSIWQSWQGIKHKKLSVKPTIMSMTTMQSESGFYCIWLANNGPGPAIIENFSIKVDDEIIPGIRDELMKKTVAELFPKMSYKLDSASMAKSYAISAKEDCKICEIKFAGPIPTAESVLASFRRAEFVIEYKSVHTDEIFHYSLRLHDF